MTTTWLEAVIPPALVLILWAILAHADNYQCTADAGCAAIMPGPDGPPPPGGGRPGKKYTTTHVFKKGDIISTSSGWIVNPTADGWVEVDFIAAQLFLPGAAP